MTRCGHDQHDLGAHALGALDPAEAATIGGRLASCAACRSEYDQLCEAVKLLELARTPPDPVPSRVHARVIADLASHRVRRRWTALGAAAAMLAALAGVGVGWQLRATDPPPVALPLESVEPFEVVGWATFEHQRGGAVLHLDIEGLGPLTAPAVYEAWLSTTDGRIVSIGQLDDAAGRLEIELPVAGDWADYRGLWITAEPDRRDPAHEGPTVFRTTVPQRG
jgi:anti-sigma factor RsiW